MSRLKVREKFNRMNSIFWVKSKVDDKGRVVIPKKIRQKLGLNNHGSILWIQVTQKPQKNNEYLIEVGIKNHTQENT